MSRLSSHVAQSLDAGLANSGAVINIPPAQLAKALRAALRHLSPEAVQEISNLLPGLGKEKEAPPSVDKVELSRAKKLRDENRIQDDPTIQKKLGFKGVLPEIPADLIEECARTNGTVVLKFKTTILDYQAKLNAALGENRGSLGLNYIDDKKLAITNEEPTWINVPNTVRDDTLGLSKANALKHVPGSQTCDPMDTVLMLGYNNLQAGRQMPGFTNKWTFTNQRNTLVGSNAYGFNVRVLARYDDCGASDVGLAPRLASESKKS